MGTQTQQQQLNYWTCDMRQSSVWEDANAPPPQLWFVGLVPPHEYYLVTVIVIVVGITDHSY